MSSKSNPVSWFEIPVTDMDRAISFYNQVFDYALSKAEMGPLTMAWFPFDSKLSGCSGSLVFNPAFYIPTNDRGVVIYFACEDVSVTLEKVKVAKGSVLQEKKQISPEHGYMGLFLDSEGNRIALYSEK